MPTACARVGGTGGGPASRDPEPVVFPDMTGQVLSGAGPLAGSGVLMRYMTNQGLQWRLLMSDQFGEFARWNHEIKPVSLRVSTGFRIRFNPE